MPVERAAGGSSLVDVLDRVLDKGIVIDAWARVSLVGIDLITVEARVVVASIDTYLKYAEAVGNGSTASRPAIEGGPVETVGIETELIERERVPRATTTTTTTRQSGRRKRPAGPAETVSIETKLIERERVPRATTTTTTRQSGRRKRPATT
jgi:hypothetical protein